jgi:hypothetical protein
MFNLQKIAIIAAGCLAGIFGTVCSAAQAATITMDFESLAQPGSGVNNIGNTYSEDGFVLKKGVGEPFPFAVFGTAESRFPGSTALFNDTSNGVITLSKQGGGLFDFLSVKLSELNGSSSASVTFKGIKSDSSTVSSTFNLDSIFGFETFSLSGFTGLTSVSWIQEPSFHQFDDIVLATDGTTSVPTPALLPGLAGLGVAALRKRKGEEAKETVSVKA